MARLFSGLTDSVVARFDRLADREKRLVLMFGGGLILVIVVGGLTLNHFSLNAKRRQMDLVHQQLKEISEQKLAYSREKSSSLVV